MSLVIIGINHKTATVDLREKVAFSPDRIHDAMKSLASRTRTGEAVIVSTCNRTELYCNNAEKEDIIEWLEDYHSIEHSDLMPCLYAYEEQVAVKHLMRVASGLDSLVLGEPQILGQVKQAFVKAKEAGTIALTIDRLFQNTFSVAKKVRTETEIGAAAVSVAFAAVSMAKHIFSSLSTTKVLLIGAGETIELVAKHLKDNGVASMVVANRTIERAQAMCEEFNATAITLEQIPDFLAKADIVISSTASPLPILGKGMVEKALKQRRHQPMLLVDIAVPRDIEAEVGELDDAFLYTVDDLHSIIEQNMASRKEAAEQAELITEDQSHLFMEWIRSLESVDSIREYRSQSLAIKDELVERALNKISHGSDSEQVILELANRLTNRLIHAPTQALTSASRQGDLNTLGQLRTALGLDKN
ncbi:glutamyl-tRNA reductase [Shewanella sp. SR43-4]|jgi:glutamyl-tRNA reductase|uniref:Glutamyl-tRNA reductase n=1 Tax=Shewanella vesiculosa TaxID=518738 RepID=A0ABV0FS45_9GAMM|nr:MULTISPECIES: glutamyl-tRNA reductase [Shewanella]NCQ46681.1 glutamyl-tRNA reductase [Shewanella frigidimarina]MBB1319225.1 glutamyl-tRNA reductase [Shewanella sp. SR43-4]MBB1321143.1 glutamyl-tRNA reductase [Shewanella sp. SR43-8]MBB1389752.1 glutamyl-tRNA reductase [Shewanella sp. SG44-6]MBB1474065.1 glutamyl-tRNA reductase [Shewanella sp. SG41-3]|tara:strand:- start:2704 stop:3954 length:1251 start_codon:yes stop_codon:yes gene_type:complete